MERLQPLTASITGIDGTGKNTALQAAVNRLSPRYAIGTLGKPSSTIRFEREREHYKLHLCLYIEHLW